MGKGGVFLEKILVVSSSPRGKEIEEAITKEEGYSCLLASPQEMESLLEREEFSSIVVDTNSLSQEILSALQKIRFFNGHVPIVSVGNRRLRREEAWFGDVDCWVEPERIELLPEVLKEVLSGPQQSLKLSILRALTSKLLAALPIAVFSLNSQGKLWYANKHCREVFQLDFSAIGTPLWEVESLCNLLPQELIQKVKEKTLEEHKEKIRWINPKGEERFFQLEVHTLDTGPEGRSLLFILSDCTSEEREKLRLLESRRLYASSLELLKRMFTSPSMEMAIQNALSIIKNDFHCHALFYIRINGNKIIKSTKEGKDLTEKDLPCTKCKAYCQGTILFGENIPKTCPFSPQGKGSWCFPIYHLEENSPQGIFRSEVAEEVRFPNLVELSMVHLASEIGLTLQRFIMFKQMEMAKREWEETFDAIKNPIILVNSQKRIIRANKAFANLVGKDVKDIVGDTCCNVVTGNEMPPSNCPLKACQAGKEQIEQEVYLPKVNREFMISVFKAKDHEGKPIFVHTMKDITELKKAQAQLFHTSKLASLGQMAAAIAHEINNPMAAISGFAEILLEEVDNPTHKRYLNNIVQAAQRVGNTVKAALLLSEAPKDEPSELIDLNSVVQEALNVIAPMANKGRIVVHTVLTPKKLTVMANSSLLVQALLAFLQNAIESIEEKKEAEARVIKVITEQGAAGESVIEISDTGRGIPSHLKGRIFHPFFTTKGYGRTGLGLSVAKSIIDKYGGTIEVESDLGLGTTFRITLPSTSHLSGEEEE